MEEIVCKEVIISRLTCFGKGIEGDPFRRIVQVFEKDGRLICENDPCQPELEKNEMIEFARFCCENVPTGKISIATLNNWRENKNL